MRRPEIGDEQGGFAIARQAPEARQNLLAGEERRDRGGGLRRIPVEKAVILPAVAKAFEEARGGGGESRVAGFGPFDAPRAGRVSVGRWRFRRPAGRLGQAGGDGRLNLLREVKVVAGEARKKRVDEMKAAQMVAAGHCFGSSGWLISSMKSERSRNSL